MTGSSWNPEADVNTGHINHLSGFKKIISFLHSVNLSAGVK